jgi:hypothetical protein
LSRLEKKRRKKKREKKEKKRKEGVKPLASLVLGVNPSFGLASWYFSILLCLD